MTILPGSLDYLYYNGITETIPYVAYEMPPVTASGRAQLAGAGMGYNPISDFDMYSPSEFQPDSQKPKSGNAFFNVLDKILSLPKWVKGLFSGGIILGTVCLLFRGKKPPANAQTTGLWQKITGWFKK